MWDGSSRPDHVPPNGLAGLLQDAPSTYTTRLEVNQSLGAPLARFDLTPVITVDGQAIELFPLQVFNFGPSVTWAIKSVGASDFENFCTADPVSRQFFEKTPRGYLEYHYDVRCGNPASILVRNLSRNR